MAEQEKRWGRDRWRDRYYAQLDRAEQAEKERDEAREKAETQKEIAHGFQDDFHRARSRIAELEGALRKAEPYLFNAPLEGALDVHAEIRAALNPEDRPE